MKALLIALVVAGTAASPGKGKTAAPAKAAPKTEVAAPAPAPAAEAPKPEVKAEPKVEAPPKPQFPEGSRGGALRVAVLEPKVAGDVPPRALAAFQQSLTDEVRKLDRVSAIGMAEVREMIAFDQQRQLLGCGEESCLQEIGGALGVDEVVSTQLTLNGDTYTMSVKRMDMRRAKVVGDGFSKTFGKDNGEELLAQVGPSVEALFPGKALKPGKSRGVDKEVARKLNPPPLPRWAFFATAGAAVVAGAGGGVFGYMSKAAEKEYQDKAQASVPHTDAEGKTTFTEVNGADLVAKEKEATSNANLANGFFIGAGALALTAGIEALFTDWNDDRSALKASATLTSGGGGMTLSGTW